MMEEKEFTASSICMYFQQREEKSSLLIPRRKDPFLKSLSGSLFKYNFPLKAEDKWLVSCMGLNMAFLSWYFWTLICFFFIIWWLFSHWVFLGSVKMRLSSTSPLWCKGSISQIAHNFPVPQQWKSQMPHDLEVFTNTMCFMKALLGKPKVIGK